MQTPSTRPCKQQHGNEIIRKGAARKIYGNNVQPPIYLITFEPSSKIRLKVLQWSTIQMYSCFTAANSTKPSLITDRMQVWNCLKKITSEYMKI